MSTDDLNFIAVTEQIAEWRTESCEVRLEERIVSNVLLSGGASKNGHRYTETALRDAAALYNRKPVFLDHAANLSKPYDRSTRDLAGWIAEACFLDGRILGEIHLLDTEAGRTLLALMSSETPAVGMSHVILARKSSDGTIVEQIHDVISVDAVVFPATTAGFREQIEGCETASDVEAVRQELEEVRGELQRVISERDELQRRCDQFEREAIERDIDRELAAAGLPEDVITSSLRERLQTAPDSAARSRLIAEHRRFVSQCRQRPPCSRARASPGADRDAVTLKQIVQAVKGRKK